MSSNLGSGVMRYVIVILALAGVVVSALALHVHYSNEVQICDINATWDCGAVGHSRYAVLAGIPVATLGILGYLAMAVAGLARARFLVAAGATFGLGFALYLSYIEARVLQVWCLYCVISQGIIALIFLLSLLQLWQARANGRVQGVGIGEQGLGTRD